ncbi:MAG: N-acetylmuramoyl-L-alanine amidase [Acidobacteriota bacterium]|jgi:N-acetylmuramoyl-L-alanine amidase|nr:N-acetylmuramoyl-L-alanine amidase [Acidobacteriota bacterium]
MRQPAVAAALVCLLLPLRAAAAKPSTLNNIRFYNYPDYTRVVLDLSRPLQIKEKILPGKDVTRLYFDLKPCRISREFPAEKLPQIPIETGNLKQVRLGRQSADTLRVVFDFIHIGRYRQFYLRGPDRIVFDIYQQQVGGPVSTPAEATGGEYSLARQLGLGVQHIILDPGHGGKDPGTMNRQLGLLEKSITLDIARRLKLLLCDKAGFKVTMTRDVDRYISLEERTAIANSGKADLFVSIHLNAAPNKKARGIETYFLSFTTDPWAIQVAAQENAVSTKSIGELHSVIEKIMQNARVTESRVLAGCVQKNLAATMKQKYSGVADLGVKKAPFYVLTGAEMPAVLVEASFLSNKEEARLLNTPAYRERIALGLYEGLLAYIHSLGKIEPAKAGSTSNAAVSAGK